MARTPETEGAPRLPTRLKELREGKGLSQGALAKIAGLTQQHYSRLETGRSRINDRLMVQLAEALRCKPIDLLDLGRAGSAPGTLKITGYVQGGAVQMFEPGDDVGEGIVEAPPLAIEREYEALRVRGDSMEPVYVDGDVVIVAAPTPNLSALWYRDCVVRDTNDNVMLKRVIPGPTKTTVTLQSYHDETEDIVGQTIKHGSPVVWVRKS